MPFTTRSQSKKQEEKFWKEQQRRAKQTTRARRQITEFYEKHVPDLTREERGPKDLYTLSKRKQFFRDIYCC